jgi:hypothetical protein
MLAKLGNLDVEVNPAGEGKWDVVVTMHHVNALSTVANDAELVRLGEKLIAMTKREGEN